MKDLNKLIFSDTPVSWRNLKAAQPFDFKFLGNIDITSILKNLSTFTEEQWNQHTTKNPNYKSVSSILWVKNDLKTGLVAEKILTNVKELLQPIYKKHYGEGDFIRVLIPKLKPGGSIPIHRDSGNSLMEVKRTHIPLITNENVFFKVGNTTKNLKVGEVWEINNAREHTVNNNSDEHRIHLIVDYKTKQ